MTTANIFTALAVLSLVMCEAFRWLERRELARITKAIEEAKRDMCEAAIGDWTGPYVRAHDIRMMWMGLTLGFLIAGVLMHVSISFKVTP